MSRRTVAGRECAICGRCWLWSHSSIRQDIWPLAWHCLLASCNCFGIELRHECVCGYWDIGPQLMCLMIWAPWEILHNHTERCTPANELNYCCHVSSNCANGLLRASVLVLRRLVNLGAILLAMHPPRLHGQNRVLFALIVICSCTPVSGSCCFHLWLWQIWVSALCLGSK